MIDQGQREWHHGVYGLLGVTYLALDRTDDAMAAFRELVREDVIEVMLKQPWISRGFDLRLAGALAKQGLIVDEVRQYVELVRKKAEEEGDKSVQDEATKILGR